MYSDVEQYLHYRIANARVLSYPFPHFFVDEIFPPDWYRNELIAQLPDLRLYKRLDETGTVPKGAYPERYVCDLEAAARAELELDGEPGPWALLQKVFGGAPFAHRVLSCFADAAMERFGADSALDYDIECRLVRDFSNYAITPHTDTPKKLVSLLFYLPEDESMKALGTSLYAPIDPNFRCEGRMHHAFGAFKRITTMPYLPNTLFGFFKTDNAFHGVERIEMPRIQRDSVLYNIYVRNVGRRSPATQP
jgi:hypothetical protein